MDVILEEALSDIGMNTSKSGIHLEFYCDQYWIKSLV